MSEQPRSSEGSLAPKRRQFLQAVGASGFATGFAGCVSGESGYPGPSDYDGPKGGIEDGEGYGIAFFLDGPSSFHYGHFPQQTYVDAVNVTYGVYSSSDNAELREDPSALFPFKFGSGNCYAYAFDHTARRLIGPRKVGFDPIRQDNHGVPAIGVDGDGYLHTFFGCHNTPIQYSRSVDPHSIAEWTHPPSGEPGSGDLPMPAGTYTCPTVREADDALYMLYRAGNPEGTKRYPSHVYGTLARTPDNGQTWEDVNEGVIDLSAAPGYHYDCYVNAAGAWADRIHLTWTVAEGDDHDDARRNVYHAAYDPDSDQMQTMSGTDLGTAVTWENAINDCLVKDTGDAVISGTYKGRGDSIRSFNHYYDPESDTAYIPASYGVEGGPDDGRSVTRVYSYEGVSDGTGTWEESEIISEQSPPSSHAQVRVTDAGQPMVNGSGVHVRQSDGRWEQRSIDMPSLDTIPDTDTSWWGPVRPVRPGTDEFSWTVSGQTIGKKDVGRRYRHLYAYGDGMAGSATYPRPPRNLRGAAFENGIVALKWDKGIAGPSSLQQYTVYVDDAEHTVNHWTDEHPSGWWSHDVPTFAKIELAEEEHDIHVTLTSWEGDESAPSNTVSVTF